MPLQPSNEVNMEKFGTVLGAHDLGVRAYRHVRQGRQPRPHIDVKTS